MTRRLLAILGVLLTLTGCNQVQQEVGVTPNTPVPLPSETATRPLLATFTPAPTSAAQPSATPDPSILTEQFVSEGEVLSFRYPAGWSVQEYRDETETVVTVQAPATVGANTAFMVNLQSIGGRLTMDDLYLLADRYLESLFDDALADLPVSYREEGGALLATVISEREGESHQFELRFVSRPPLSQVLVLIAPPGEWDHFAPTLDAIARSVAVNTEQATPMITPTPAVARQSDGLSAENVHLFEAVTGSLYLVGEIQNASDLPYEDVQVRVELLGADGAVVAHTRWRTQLQLLHPGARSPLLVIFNEPPEKWGDYRMSVEGLPADYYLQRITSDFEVSELQATAEPPFGDYQLSGQVRNVGDAARFIEVIGVLYGEAGRILAVEGVPLERDVLPNGEAAPFTLTFFSKAEGEVARHEILVEGTRLEGQE